MQSFFLKFELLAVPKENMGLSGSLKAILIGNYYELDALSENQSV